jgi:hypothetical protein
VKTPTNSAKAKTPLVIHPTTEKPKYSSQKNSYSYCLNKQNIKKENFVKLLFFSQKEKCTDAFNAKDFGIFPPGDKWSRYVRR